MSPPYEQSGNGSCTLLILGDSTGYGTGATRSSESVAGLIGAAYPDMTIINKSKNGRTARELKDTVQRIEGYYDAILLQIGANDLLKQTPPSEVVTVIVAIARELQFSTDRVIVMTSGNIGGASRFDTSKRQLYTERSREYDQLMKAASEKKLFEFVSLFKEYEQDPFVLHPQIYLAIDGLHPSSAGYKIWFSQLQKILVSIRHNTKVSKGEGK